jgi:hypothetical protein
MKDAGLFPKLNKGPVREPIWTLQELAAEFLITPGSLRNHLRRSDAPKAMFRHNSPATCSRTYYPVKAMRAWWETVKDKA